MKQSSLTRRLLAGAAGLMIGVAGLVAFATPASATGGGNDPSRYGKVTGLTGEAVCDLETETWTVTWTVSNPSSHFQATVTALSSEVEGIALNDVVGTESSLVGTQTFPTGTESAELTVELKWAWQVWGHWKSVTSEATETVTLGECAEEEPPPPPPPPPPPAEEPAGGNVDGKFDCDVFVMIITSDADVDADLVVVPSVGDSVPVTVPAGETVEVEVPSSEGLVVDLQNLDGETVIDGEPFEITSEDWADAGCAEGEGGELPATGSSTGLIALGAVALLALGGGLFLVARRRRVTFTA